MFQQLAGDDEPSAPGGRVQGALAPRIGPIDVRTPVDVAFDLVQIAALDGAVEIDRRRRRLAAGTEQQDRERKGDRDTNRGHRAFVPGWVRAWVLHGLHGKSGNRTTANVK